METKGHHSFPSPLDEENLAPKLPPVKFIVNCTRGYAITGYSSTYSNPNTA